GMVRLEPGRAENGHARPDEVERAESPDELPEDRQDRPELAAPRARPFEKDPLFRFLDGELDERGLARLLGLRRHRRHSHAGRQESGRPAVERSIAWRGRLPLLPSEPG